MPDSTAKPRDRVARSWHIHILNAPDMAQYQLTPARLRSVLEDLIQHAQLTLTVTQSTDSAIVTDEMKDAEVLVCHSLPMSRIADLPRLRLIHLASAGIDHLLPLDWLPRRVILTNSSGIHADVAGEYVLCALLMLNIGMPAYVDHQRRAEWSPKNNNSIRGKVAVVLGLGALGSVAAQQAKTLGLRVIGIRRSARPHRYADEVVGPGALREVLPEADFLVITNPLTPASRGMIGREELGLLKESAGLINISRAGVVDSAALAERLNRHELSGAIVDVWDEEPLPQLSPFWQVRNLVITPHISADVPPIEYGERVMMVLKDNLARLVEAKPLKTRIHRMHGY
jgi:phosphoglycerate dehydrogenase-like enzyme